MGKLIGRRWQRRLPSGSSVTDHGSWVLAPALAVLFSLMLVPAWLDALSRVEDERSVTAVIVGVVYSAACVIAVPVSTKMSSTARLVFCLVLLATGLGFIGLTDPSNFWVLLCALGIVAVLLSTVATAAITSVVVFGLSVGAVQTGTFSQQFPNLAVLVSVTTAVALMVRLFDANAELKRARDRVAALAVEQERERFARDLHDILGHSLTTITVKASTARRVLETGDVDRSITEIGDVERLGRQALTDVRATVSEYRETTLVGELAAAGETLRAAGIEAELPHAVDDVDSRSRQVFGYVLREAITNAVRHSGAHRVGVRLGRDWITVIDDGAGAGAGQEETGNGLNGLAEQVRELDGSFEAGPGGQGGFVVRASVPDEPSTSTARDGAEDTTPRYTREAGETS
ncbi:two-component system sensor histidine kinase DesK [Saccharopolyspora lacisalsi]|uniref:Two-component system sensor histidine kinase DesK n=1 Tax=Halosaccharopolyspora lacisalsi TaxID=1000566 RepID=A0A839DUD5_9PSEU|nr:sensor histidine kinase [Halosaccharopolyspora lacisalsi]MBA8824530.1 two-component system sensor histidine kinase DesK [Halosaccharopolyspora lacisalsi]